MELDQQEVRDGWTWLVCAGAAAICLSVFLYYVDNYLSFSDREQQLGRTLKELRTAQFTVAGGETDVRELGAAPVTSGLGESSVYVEESTGH